MNCQNVVHIAGDRAHADGDRFTVIGDARNFAVDRFLRFDRRARSVRRRDDQRIRAVFQFVAAGLTRVPYVLCP